MRQPPTLQLIGGTDFDKRAASERDFNRKVGQRLRDRRNALCISQAVMAEHLGVDDTMVGRHETGATPLTCVRAFRMCQLLKLPMAELFK